MLFEDLLYICLVVYQLYLNKLLSYFLIKIGSYLHISFKPTSTYLLYILCMLQSHKLSSVTQGNKCISEHCQYFSSLREKIRWNHCIFILILCLVFLCLCIEMIGAVERVSKYNGGSLFSYFRAVVLKYCLAYNFQLHKSSSIIKYFFLIELNRVTVFSQEKMSGEMQGLLLTHKIFLL